MAKKLSVLFATFSPWENNKRMPTNGMIEPMLSFFVPRTKTFTLIDEPHPGSNVLIPIIEIYKNGKLVKKTKSSFFVSWLYPFLLTRNSVGTRTVFKIRDFLAILDFALRQKTKYDLFIGLESVNAIAGVILKKLGLIKKVVYYVSDYSLQRYQSSWFNSLYLWLDRLAATKADFIWDVSQAMMPARIKAGLNPKKAAPLIHVPNALFPEQINYLPIKKLIFNSLVYAGTLGIENGPDLAIKAFSLVIKKVPNASLHIFVGGKNDLERLKKLSQKLHLNKEIFFHGFVSDQIALSNEINKYAIGLAPYKAIPGSPRWWADATKIRLYLAAGLPVITTQVPPLGKELVDENAGLVVKDNPEELSRAIKKIFTDRELYFNLRKNAMKKAKGNTWENTYKNALSAMGFHFN